ncbi:MAG TPA: hypothetical protein VE422_30570 [Terriglobia bacterium]|nr:hypothetical protein [Terriglobia bacterium]
MKKLILSVIGFFLVTIGIVIGYKHQKPRTDQPASSTEIIQKCHDWGETYRKQFEKDTEDNGHNSVSPEYGYSQKLNTCVFSAGTFNAMLGTHEFVLDLATNRTLAEYDRRFGSGYIPTVDERIQDIPWHIEYLTRKKEIFGSLSPSQDKLLTDLNSYPPPMK